MPLVRSPGSSLGTVTSSTLTAFIPADQPYHPAEHLHSITSSSPGSSLGTVRSSTFISLASRRKTRALKSFMSSSRKPAWLERAVGNSSERS